jgi:Cu/Zn superoxide dismutase
MNDAWAQSGNAGENQASSGQREAGFNLNGTPSNYSIKSTFTNEPLQMTIKVNNLNNLAPTIANFHIHPKGGDQDDGKPSTPKNSSNHVGDTGAFDALYNLNQNGRHQAVPVFVMSWYGLALYLPGSGVPPLQVVQGTGFLKGVECPH